MLTFTDGGSLTVKDYFAATGPNIEGVEFTTGGSWSAAELAAMAAAATATFNTAPIARDDMFSFTGAATVTVATTALLDNDFDANGDTLTITNLSNISGGQAVLDGHGNVVITRASATGGTVSFDYSISDGHGGSSHAAFNIAMTPGAPTNARPVIVSSTLAPVIEDTPASGRIVATDAENDPLTYAIKAGAGPAKGSVVISSDGAFIFTPNANANGDDSFTLTVSDGHNTPVDSTFQFTIAAVNDPPVAVADSGFTVKSEQKITISAAALLNNDTDVEGDRLKITGVSAAHGGTVALAADGTITFKAGDDYIGPASFNYTITDGHGGFSTAKVDLTVVKESHKTHDVTGTEGNDRLYGTHDDDVFTGKGGSDTFIFRPAGGHDQINDFQAGGAFGATKDILDLRGDGFTSYRDLISHMDETAAGTQISLHDGSTILLKGMHEAALTVDNFKIL
jgi:hypothetical protein